jgi:hypothetical protein
MLLMQKYKYIFFVILVNFVIKNCLNPDGRHDDEESGAHQHVCCRNLHKSIIQLINGTL